VPQADGVEEIRRAEHEGRDDDLDEGAPLFCVEGGATSRAEKQPGRNQGKHKPGDLMRSQRLAEQNNNEKDRDDEIHAED